MEPGRKISLNRIYLLVAAGAIIYLSFLGRVPLFDWDEINFAECAREMIILQNYLSVHIDFEPFWEKPPFFFWLQVLSMKLLGISEYAARYPNAVLGLITLPALYYLGTKLQDSRFGWNWSILYACSFLPLFYFKSGIIDPWFNAFIFFSYISMFVFLKNNKLQFLLASGLALGFAILTKGPAALLILGLCGLVITILHRRLPLPLHKLLLWFFLVLIVPGTWFLVEYLLNGPEFITKFIRYQIRLLTTEDAGHGGFPGYHFVVVLLGCFPASVIAFPHLFKKFGKNDIHSWMQVLLWVVLILFSLVQSKIIHYSSLTYFPLTFLAASYMSKSEFKWTGIQKVFMVLISLFWFAVIAAIPFLVPQLPGMFDENTISESAKAILSLEVDWPKWLAVISLFAIAPLIIYGTKLSSANKKMASAISYILFIEGILFFYMPKVEQYTQGPAIEFYKEKQQVECYVENWGFKTYADLFYTRKMPEDKLGISLEQALQEGADLPLFIVTKVYRKERFEQEYPKATLLYQKGEFVFYEREVRPE